jgi:hypothetical protein
MKFYKHGLLAAVAVTALAAGGALAQQSPNAPSGSGIQGGSQMEKQEQKAPGMQGQGQSAPKGQVQGQGQSAPRGQVQGQDQRSPSGTQTQGGQNGEKKDRMQSQQPGGKTDKSAQEPRQKNEGTAQDSKRDGSKAAQGESKDGKQSVQLNNDQRTKISQTIKDKNVNLRTVNRSEINFSINVGTVVPRSVTLYPLPAPIIAVVPAYRGYLYIVVDGDLLIIHPTTHEIVAVIPA